MTDMDGQMRILNGRVDMGADEFGSFVFGARGWLPPPE